MTEHLSLSGNKSDSTPKFPNWEELAIFLPQCHVTSYCNKFSGVIAGASVFNLVFSLSDMLNFQWPVWRSQEVHYGGQEVSEDT